MTILDAFKAVYALMPEPQLSFNYCSAIKLNEILDWEQMPCMTIYQWVKGKFVVKPSIFTELETSVSFMNEVKDGMSSEEIEAIIEVLRTSAKDFIHAYNNYGKFENIQEAPFDIVYQGVNDRMSAGIIISFTCKPKFGNVC